MSVLKIDDLSVSHSQLFEELDEQEMNQIQGGALPLLGKIFVRVAAKGIIYLIDRVTD
jgi:lactobin A/cerein 7B family class IIb bacteriocin